MVKYVDTQMYGGPFDLDWLMRWAIPEPNSGCYLWTGAYVGDGYGTVTVRRRTWPAHRLSYTLAKGDIPFGFDVDHTCKVTSCINPDHLEAVTRQVNVLRSSAPAAARARFAAMTHCKRGHEFTAKNTRLSKDGFRVCRVCERSRWEEWVAAHPGYWRKENRA